MKDFTRPGGASGAHRRPSPRTGPRYRVAAPLRFLVAITLPLMGASWIGLPGARAQVPTIAPGQAPLTISLQQMQFGTAGLKMLPDPGQHLGDLRRRRTGEYPDTSKGGAAPHRQAVSRDAAGPWATPASSRASWTIPWEFSPISSRSPFRLPWSMNSSGIPMVRTWTPCPLG